LYVRAGSYGNYVMRFTRDGKRVPFPRGETPITENRSGPPVGYEGEDAVGLYNGVHGWCNVHQRGLHVAPDGRILSGDNEIDPQWAVEHGLVSRRADGSLPDKKQVFSHLTIFHKSGKLLVGSAFGGDNRNGHGYTMDRRGNIYATWADTQTREDSPYYQTPLFGLKGDQPIGNYGGVGVIIKFLDRGGKYPIGQLKPGESEDGRNMVSVGGRRLSWDHSSPYHAENAHWIYGGIAPSTIGCSCAHVRWEMDDYPRLWLPALHLHSVVVLDGNGNLITRVGRYGNIDDDRKSKGEGLPLIFPRCVGASDEAVYIADTTNYRLIRARLVYRASEQAAVP
jgi:hypothetical protein